MTICCLLGRSETEESVSFARYISSLLDTPLLVQRLDSEQYWTDRSWIARATESRDLVLVRAPSIPFWKRWRIGNPARWLAEQIVPSSLVISRPHWPFRRLLLIARNDKSDEAAAAWAIRLARKSKAAVTVLPVVPPLPNMFSLSDDLQEMLASLMKSDSPLGQTLRQIKRELEKANLCYEFQLQRGTPDWQVAEALSASEYELLIAGAETGGWSCRFLVGEFIAPLMRWLDQPILIAKP